MGSLREWGGEVGGIKFILVFGIWIRVWFFRFFIVCLSILFFRNLIYV